MRRTKKVRRAVSLLLLVYLAYVLVGGLVPYAFPPEVSTVEAARLSAVEYTSPGEGPDRAALIEDPVNALDVRIQLLREANDTLDIVYHTVQFGDSAQAFFGEVVLAADRGVAVRVIVDAKAGALTPSGINMLKAVAAHPGVEMRGYNSLNLLKPWEWNTLLHDKFILVDDEYLLLGGRNIGDTYFAPENYEKSVTNDRDVFIWNEGGDVGSSVVQDVQDYMALLWNSEDTTAYPVARAKKADGALDTLRGAAQAFEQANPAYYQSTLAEYKNDTLPTNNVTLVHNPINTNVKEAWIGYALRDIILDAEQSVTIQTPYATANKGFLQMLADSAANVPTTLLTNSVASSPNYPAFSNYYANRQRFLDTGISIYEYQSGNSIHGKSLVVDGRVAVVGSFNMDDRSLTIDTETMLVIHSEPFAQRLQQAMDVYMEESLRVDADGSYLPGSVEAVPVGTGKKLGMWLFSLISRPFQFLI